MARSEPCLALALLAALSQGCAESADGGRAPQPRAAELLELEPWPGSCAESCSCRRQGA
jgi:hypothetical protein